MKRLRLSWVPDDVIDPQNMVWHPFGITHRRGGGYDWHPAWETTWYWRRYYIHFINVFHPRFWRDRFKNNGRERWRSIRFFLSRVVTVGRG